MNVVKLGISLTAAILLIGSVAAQTNTFPVTGNVGIGTTTPSSALEIALARNDTVGAGALTLNGLQKYSFRSTATLPANGLAIDAFNGATWSTPLVIDNTGNVGIGTTAPTAKLEVIGGARPFGLIVEGDGVSANARIALRRANATGASATGNIDWIGNDNAVGARIGVNDDVAGSMAFKLGGGTLGYTRMFISSAGNVGIGTTTPVFPLQVSGYNSSVQLRLERTNTGQGVFDIGADDAGLTFYPGGYPASGVSKFFIGASGNVGIGTTNPQAKLQIGGWNFIKDGTWAPPLAPDVSSAGERIVFYQGGGWKTAIGMDGQNGIWFQAHTPNGQVAYQWFTGAVSTAPTEKMRIMDNGNVGIGTTSPSHKLAVNGTIRAKEVIVDTGWADDVFAKDYRLAPLSEVEVHIKTVGRLPDVPSAQEIAANGVSVGEAQSILLRKIEELTLHQIEQEKRAVAQEERLNEQAARIRTLEQENSALRQH